MLSRTYRTAAELGLPEVERDALVATLIAAESGEIPDEKFNMGLLYWCGTPSCLAGWAHHLSNGAAFPELAPCAAESGPARPFDGRLPAQLVQLFALAGVAPVSTIGQMARLPVAVRALRGYLETGVCDWEAALAAEEAAR